MSRSFSLQDELEIWRHQRSSMRFVAIAIILGVSFIVLGSAAVVTWPHGKAKPKTQTAKVITPPATKPAAATTQPAQAAATKTFYVNASNGINLRSEANATSSILVVIPYGSAITVDQDQSPWSHGSYGGHSGYFQKQYTVSDKSALTP